MSEGGILAIKGVKSQYYICMSKAGQLQGKVVFLLLGVGNVVNKCVCRVCKINSLVTPTFLSHTENLQ